MNILLAFSILTREATEALFQTKEGQRALKAAWERAQNCRVFGGEAFGAAGGGGPAGDGRSSRSVTARGGSRPSPRAHTRQRRQTGPPARINQLQLRLRNKPQELSWRGLASACSACPDLNADLRASWHRSCREQLRRAHVLVRHQPKPGRQDGTLRRAVPAGGCHSHHSCHSLRSPRRCHSLLRLPTRRQPPFRATTGRTRANSPSQAP